MLIEATLSLRICSPISFMMLCGAGYPPLVSWRHILTSASHSAAVSICCCSWASCRVWVCHLSCCPRVEWETPKTFSALYTDLSWPLAIASKVFCSHCRTVFFSLPLALWYLWAFTKVSGISITKLRIIVSLVHKNSKLLDKGLTFQEIIQFNMDESSWLLYVREYFDW